MTGPEDQPWDDHSWTGHPETEHAETEHPWTPDEPHAEHPVEDLDVDAQSDEPTAIDPTDEPADDVPPEAGAGAGARAGAGAEHETEPAAPAADPWGTDDVLTELDAPDWLQPDLLPSPAGATAEPSDDAGPGRPELSDWVHRTWQATAAQSPEAGTTRPATVLDELHAIIEHSTDRDVSEAAQAVLRMSYFA